MNYSTFQIYAKRYERFEALKCRLEHFRKKLQKLLELIDIFDNDPAKNLEIRIENGLDYLEEYTKRIDEKMGWENGVLQPHKF